LTDLFSGVITLAGGKTVKVTTADGDPLMLPLGAKCFGQETGDGGATSVEIDHGSLEDAVEVTAGTPEKLQQLSLTATNTFLCTPDTCPGALIISKLLSGAGVKPFGGDDEFAFEVSCTLGDEPVFDTTVTLAANGADSVVSDELGPIPGGAECVVTEVGAGSADEPPAPVTVTVPWDGEVRTSGVVTASLTNYYSAGYLSIAKVLQGDHELVAKVRNKSFKVQVTCQIEENDQIADLYSGIVSVRAGQVVDVEDAAGDRVYLPVGAWCFGTEIDSGGATESTVDFDGPDNALSVAPGTPEKLQRLVLTVTNTFLCDEESCPKELPFTGSNPAGTVLIGLVLVLLGGSLVLLRRSHRMN
jgi:LPXTG-motif cell wall-anchored protein